MSVRTSTSTMGPWPGPSDIEGTVFADVHRRLFASSEIDVRVGRYRLLHRIGRGGFGCVFRAYDPELDRRVAVKLRQTGGDDDPRMRDDLLEEARALARFRHPNVVSVFDVGRYELSAADAARLDPSLALRGVFVVMELLPGESLASWLREPRPWRRVLEVFVQAATGLAAAHEAGLVHRDVKPSNLLIEPDGCVRVTDFGLARSVGAGAEPPLGPSPTEPGAAIVSSEVMGTPAFMAPEQLEGHADPRSDQYSFCIALHLALTGRLPFDTADPRAMWRAKRGGAISLARRPRRLPSAVWRAVMRGMAPDPRDRFPDMMALRRAIDPAHLSRGVRLRWASAGVALAILGGGAMMRAPDSATEEIDCTAASARIAALWSPRIAGDLQLRLSSLGAHAGAAQRVVDALDEIARDWTTAREHACEAPSADLTARVREHCLDGQLDGLAAAIDVLQHSNAAVIERLPEIVEVIPRAEECDHPGARTPAPREALPSSGAARAELARIDALVAGGELERAERALGELVAQAEPRTDPALAIATARARARLAAERGGIDESLALDRETLELAAENGDEVTVAHIELSIAAYLAFSAEDRYEARVWLERAEHSYLRAGSPRAQASALEFTRGALAQLEGDFAAAERHFALALLHAVPRLPVAVTSVANALTGATQLALQRGDPSGAVESARALVELQRATRGRPGTAELIAQGILADALARSGDVPAALRLRRENVAQWRTAAPGHPVLARELAILASSSIRHEDYDAAAALAREAAQIMASALGPEHAATIQARVTEIEASIHDDPALAVERLTEECERTRTSRAGRSQAVATCLSARARALRRTGRPEAALTDLRAALAVARNGGSQAMTIALGVLLDMAELELELGRTSDAKVTLDDAAALEDGVRPLRPRRRALSARWWNDAGEGREALAELALARDELDAADASISTRTLVDLEQARAQALVDSAHGRRGGRR